MEIFQFHVSELRGCKVSRCVYCWKKPSGKKRQKWHVKKNGTVHCTCRASSRVKIWGSFSPPSSWIIRVAQKSGKIYGPFPWFFGKNFISPTNPSSLPFLVGVGSLPKKWWFGGGLVSQGKPSLPKIGPKHNIQVKDFNNFLPRWSRWWQLKDFWNFHP